MSKSISIQIHNNLIKELTPISTNEKHHTLFKIKDLSPILIGGNIIKFRITINGQIEVSTIESNFSKWMGFLSIVADQWEFAINKLYHRGFLENQKKELTQEVIRDIRNTIRIRDMLLEEKGVLEWYK